MKLQLGYKLHIYTERNTTNSKHFISSKLPRFFGKDCWVRPRYKINIESKR